MQPWQAGCELGGCRAAWAECWRKSWTREHLWEHWKSDPRLQQDKGHIFPYCLCELQAEITAREETYSASEDMQATCHPRRQLVVNYHLQPSSRQGTFEVRELLLNVSFWTDEPWQAGGSNGILGILHPFCWWSRFASCLLNVSSKCVCMVKISLLELVSGVDEQKTNPEYWMFTSLGKFMADMGSCAQYWARHPGPFS